MLELKLQYFGHLMQRADSLEKILILGKIEGKRRSGWQRMRWLDSITDSMDINLSKLQEILEEEEPELLQTMEKVMAPHSSTLAWKISWAEEPGRLQSMGSLRVRHD